MMDDGAKAVGTNPPCTDGWEWLPDGAVGDAPVRDAVDGADGEFRALR